MRRKLLAALGGVVAIVGLLSVRSCVADDPLDRLNRTETPNGDVFTGSWHFPRGGPYVLGFQCPDTCTLRINGERLKKGKGLQKKWRVYDAGVYDVTFTRSGGGRLLWHPPGRRGPMEYVSPSSLSPSPREKATFSSSAGSAQLDGAIALLCLLVVIVVVVLLLGGVYSRSSPSDRGRWLEIAGVFAVALAVRLIGLGDAGQTFDEDTNWTAGKNYVTNLLNLDFSNESWIWNLEHPPLMKYIAGIGAQFSDGFGPARALSAVMLSSACALLVPIARRLGLGRAGLYAGIVAALTPHLIGHGQIVGHESAMALTYALAILAALAVWPNDGRSRLELRLAICGAAVGLAVASRFVNGLVGPLTYFIVVLCAPKGRRIETAWKAALIMPGAAVLVFILLWPRMWTAPVEHLQEAWSVLKKPHASEPYLGALTNRPPRSYFVVYLLATAPLGVLVAAAVGLGWLVSTKRRAAAVLLVWLAIPLIVTLSPVRQDGVRYILPSLFAFATLAGAGVSFLGQKVRSRWPSRHILAPLPAAFLAVYLALSSAQIRPYFIDYYGEHVGGPEGVSNAKRFEIGWWGEGLDKAIAYVNQNAQPGDRFYRGCILPGHLAWFRYSLWKRGEAKRAKDANWVIVYGPNATRCRAGPGFERVFEVSARGAPLAWVYRRVPADPTE